MNQPKFAGTAGLLFVLIAGPGVLHAQSGRPAAPESGVSIEDAIRAATPEVREYNDHLSFLGHPFLDGRLTGTRGMEIAKNYVEDHFRNAGLVPAYVGADGQRSFRQDFTVANDVDLVSQSLVIGDWAPDAGRDYSAISLGSAKAARGPAVFVGYSIERGSKDYSSYQDGDDLSGQVAVMLRFEPMDEAGKSQWNERGWSARAGFRRKVDDAVKRGAIGVVIINTPGASDDRADILPTFKSGGRSAVDVPVFVLSTRAGQELVRRLGAPGTSLMDLRRAADAGRIVQPLTGGGAIALDYAIEEHALIGQNISGLIPGKGNLANEIVVLGAHLDHLGMGEFGSRSGPGELHPGADDNASGSAAMIMLAERITKTYAALPEGTPARTILIQCYDAEESGLIGSAFYTREPIRPIADHVLMLNFDMIGRISEHRLSVSGLGSAKGLKEFAQPFFESTPLVIVPKDGAPAASDHWPFYQAEVPVLFAICDPLHEDYHTPRDTVDKINRVDAVEAMKLWEQLAVAAALRTERFEFTTAQQAARPRRADAETKPEAGDEKPPQPAPSGGPTTGNVRLGIQPGNYGEEGNGVLVDRVGPDSPADKAGIIAGDRIVKFAGEPLDPATLGQLLAGREPGDVVELVLVRDGKDVTVSVTLVAKQE